MLKIVSRVAFICLSYLSANLVYADPQSREVRLERAKVNRGQAPGPTFSIWNPYRQIFGSAREFTKLGPIGFIDDLFTRYGRDGSPVRIPPVRLPGLGSGPTFLITHPDDIGEVLKNTDVFIKGKTAKDLARALLEGGISVTETDQVWRSYRHLIVPFFGPKAIEAYVDSIGQMTQIFLDRMEQAQGISVDMQQEMTIYTTQLNSKVLLNANISAREALQLANAVKITQAYLQQQATKPQARVPCCNRMYMRQRKALAYINQFSARLIHEDRIRQISEEPGTENSTLIRKLRDHFEALGTPQAEINLRAQVKNIYFGGFDAPTHFLTSGYVRLAQNPEIQKNLREEVRKTLGDLTKRSAGEIAEASLPQLENFVKEVLRMDASGPIVPRDVTENYSLTGYRIPKGSTVILSYHYLHRLPEFWENPNEFNPARFSKKWDRNAFKPFGGGQRACVAPRLTELEGKILFAYVLGSSLQFNFKPDAKIKTYFESTYKYEGGVPMIWGTSPAEKLTSLELR